MRNAASYTFLRFPIALRCWAPKHGPSRPQRAEADTKGVALHHCPDEGPGFFVEVSADYGQEQPVVRRSFVSSVPLEDYGHYARLPEE